MLPGTCKRSVRTTLRPLGLDGKTLSTETNSVVGEREDSEGAELELEVPGPPFFDFCFLENRPINVINVQACKWLPERRFSWVKPQRKLARREEEDPGVSRVGLGGKMGEMKVIPM